VATQRSILSHRAQCRLPGQRSAHEDGAAGSAPTYATREQANIGTEVLRVPGDFEQRCSTGAKEQIVKQPLVLKHERGEFVGQCENDVEVGHGQQLGRTRGEPLAPCVALALGTVPVTTGLIRDGLMSTAKTLIAMTSQRRSATTDDSVHDLAMLPGQELLIGERAMSRLNDGPCLLKQVCRRDKKLAVKRVCLFLFGRTRMERVLSSPSPLDNHIAARVNAKFTKECSRLKVGRTYATSSLRFGGFHAAPVLHCRASRRTTN
jgi:hypothetical protein